MRFAALTLLSLTATLALGCGASAPVKGSSTAAATATLAPVGAGTAAVVAQASAALPAAVSAFQEERLTGAMALFDTRDARLACSDSARCERGYLPASTFKIANTIIGLETGVLSDAETPLPWDGKERSVPAWNRDHTLRSAVQVSCVPCFQGIARQVG